MKGTAYFLQAALVSIWWVFILISPKFYSAFEFPTIGKLAFMSFLLPDVIIIVILSILRAYTKNSKIDYIILGGFAYGALFCLSAMTLTNGGYLATIVMILGVFYNVFLINNSKAFKVSNSNSFIVNLLKTSV